MDKQRLLGLLDGFSGKKLLVLGDMVADDYWFGEPTGRISREAPIPILRERSRQTRPGGATNPGYNARTLGAEVHLAGVIGDDASGRDLAGMLSEAGVDVKGLVVDPKRPTYTKIRVVTRPSPARSSTMPASSFRTSTRCCSPTTRTGLSARRSWTRPSRLLSPTRS